ncbi:MAG: hypothetical protein IT281_01445 [Ignavibacteria bacterium]|nr:hypothetical protein [Ignavibacteria bacterium]
MKKQKNEIKAPKELQTLVKQIYYYYPAEPGKMYDLNFGKKALPFCGELINDFHTILFQETMLPGETPEIMIERKRKAGLLVMKRKILERLRLLDNNLPDREYIDILKLAYAVTHNDYSDETIRLAEKYGLL